MAAPQSLEEIIRKECLPMRDCMLTVTDAHGEAAFLYFKEAELIEANYAALWGKDALAQIVTWRLADRTLAPLPLGIKRSLWDQLEYLLDPRLAPTASGRLPKLPPLSERSSAPASPFDRFKAVPNLLKMVYLDSDKETVIYEGGHDRSDTESTEWMIDFAKRVKEVGDTLGFGMCEKWTVDTERYQAVGLSHDASFITLIRRKDVVQDDLETAVNTIIEEG
jgi:hypothetical protein